MVDTVSKAPSYKRKLRCVARIIPFYFAINNMGGRGQVSLFVTSTARSCDVINFRCGTPRSALVP